MKTTALAVGLSFLVLSGWALAAQNTEPKQEPSMMDHMMKEGKGKESNERMMQMMKMMDQCSKMMESEQSDSRGAKQRRM